MNQPNVPSWWIGLALSQEMNKNYPLALSSFENVLKIKGIAFNIRYNVVNQINNIIKKVDE